MPQRPSAACAAQLSAQSVRRREEFRSQITLAETKSWSATSSRSRLGPPKSSRSASRSLVPASPVSSPWDASEVSAERISEFARKLLDSGAVYICTWGSDCERVHDIIDEEEVGPNPPPHVDRVVMTTWHAGEPLAEAIWFVLNNSWPDEGYRDGCASTLGVTIGSAEWAAEIHSTFSDPRGFSAGVLERE